MSNELTLSGIFQVIDNHMESETQFMFVTDKQLAEIICEYVADNYGLIDEDMELDDKYKDYYVSLYIDEDGLRFFCETARGINGEYKTCDAINDSVDYFICTDMSEREVHKYLLGDYCTWSWIEVVREDKNRDCEDKDLEDVCECPICEAEREIQELECYCSECQEDFMKDSIGQCLERVFNGCPDCGIEAVVNLAFKCLEFGKRNVKQEMLEFLED